MATVSINMAVLASPTPTPPKSQSDPLDCLETISSYAVPVFQCLGAVAGISGCWEVTGQRSCSGELGGLPALPGDSDQ